MKLAEALQYRADLMVVIQQLRNRLDNNVIVQEGETTAEDPIELIHQLDSCLEKLEQLICRINKTNCSVNEEGITITDLLAKRDCLAMKIKAYRGFLSSASQNTYRATRKEIKILSTISVKDYQKQVDKLSKELRQTEIKIQSLNWTTELL